MTAYPIFLSVVLVARNRSALIEALIAETSAHISDLCSDHELIIVDNASVDDSITVLKHMTREGGTPNLQVYALTKEVDFDTAAWVGLENALGDFVVVIDPIVDDIKFLPDMLKKSVEGADVVFAANRQYTLQGVGYRMANATFNHFYYRFNGVHLAKEAPQYRLLSKRVVNFILQHPQPALTYRHLPATGGFSRHNLSYDAAPKLAERKPLGESINRGIRLLVSTTKAPMRLVTSLTLFGAIANVIYSIYVIVVGLLKANVAPGWVSMSLQMSGMFFLISLVLLVLGEYILHMTSLSNGGPLYHVGQEFTSARIIRREKLNIEEATSTVDVQHMQHREASR